MLAERMWRRAKMRTKKKDDWRVGKKSRKEERREERRRIGETRMLEEEKEREGQKKQRGKEVKGEVMTENEESESR